MVRSLAGYAQIGGLQRVPSPLLRCSTPGAVQERVPPYDDDICPFRVRCTRRDCTRGHSAEYVDRIANDHYVRVHGMLGCQIQVSGRFAVIVVVDDVVVVVVVAYEAGRNQVGVNTIEMYSS